MRQVMQNFLVSLMAFSWGIVLSDRYLAVEPPSETQFAAEVVVLTRAEAPTQDEQVQQWLQAVETRTGGLF